jgi:hypothetical protein
MNCPKCNQAVEDGAAFCGNCGQPLDVATTPPASPIAQVMQNQLADPASAQPLNSPLVVASSTPQAASVPGYAIAKPSQHIGESKALLALLCGIAGIAGGLFMALIGLALGVIGLIMGTMSRSSTKRSLSTAGLVMSSLAILVGLATWVYAIKHDPNLQQASKSTTHSITAPAVAASDLSTPCYSVGFVNKLNINNDKNSCDMNAFNGPTIANSTNAYKVYANQSNGANTDDFTSLVKPAIEKDIKDNLPGFSINNEQLSQFAGSPAYVVSTFNKTTDVAVIEAAVLHRVGNGDNLFILVHAVNGRSTDLNTLEAEWQWK